MQLSYASIPRQIPGALPMQPAQAGNALPFHPKNHSGIYMSDKPGQDSDDSKAARLSRIVIAVMSCLGALGLLALLYFPLQHLK
jgi:hypothetical protein